MQGARAHAGEGSRAKGRGRRFAGEGSLDLGGQGLVDVAGDTKPLLAHARGGHLGEYSRVSGREKSRRGGGREEATCSSLTTRQPPRAMMKRSEAGSPWRAKRLQNGYVSDSAGYVSDTNLADLGQGVRGWVMRVHVVPGRGEMCVQFVPGRGEMCVQFVPGRGEREEAPAGQ